MKLVELVASVVIVAGHLCEVCGTLRAIMAIYGE